MSITDIYKRGIVVGFEQLKVEELAVKEQPRTAHMPRDWRTDCVIGKNGMIDATHEDGTKLNSSAVNHWQLKQVGCERLGNIYKQITLLNLVIKTMENQDFVLMTSELSLYLAYYVAEPFLFILRAITWPFKKTLII